MSFKIAKNFIIKNLLAIVGTWRWVPHGGPDLDGDKIAGHSLTLMSSKRFATVSDQCVLPL